MLSDNAAPGSLIRRLLSFFFLYKCKLKMGQALLQLYILIKSHDLDNFGRLSSNKHFCHITANSGQWVLTRRFLHIFPLGCQSCTIPCQMFLTRYLKIFQWLPSEFCLDSTSMNNFHSVPPSNNS